jgi:hypothetical protein
MVAEKSEKGVDSADIGVQKGQHYHKSFNRGCFSVGNAFMFCEPCNKSSYFRSIKFRKILI